MPGDPSDAPHPLVRFKVTAADEAGNELVVTARRYDGVNTGPRDYKIAVKSARAVDDEIYATIPEGGTGQEWTYAGAPRKVLWMEVGAGGTFGTPTGLNQVWQVVGGDGTPGNPWVFGWAAVKMML